MKKINRDELRRVLEYLNQEGYGVIDKNDFNFAIRQIEEQEMENDWIIDNLEEKSKLNRSKNG